MSRSSSPAMKPQASTSASVGDTAMRDAPARELERSSTTGAKRSHSSGVRSSAMRGAEQAGGAAGAERTKSLYSVEDSGESEGSGSEDTGSEMSASGNASSAEDSDFSGRLSASWDSDSEHEWDEEKLIKANERKYWNK